MEEYLNKIINGDCLEVMKKLPDKCVDLTVTSPPYDNLRAYNGYSFDFEGIAQELYRITKEGGVVVWVVGDATIKGSETGTSFRQALYFKEIGFNIYDTMIYGKINTPPLNHKRYEQQFEYMFVFSKGIPKTVNLITERCIVAGKTNTGTMRNNGSDKLTIKHGTGKPVKQEKTKGNIWFYSVGTDGESNGHPAVFPYKLAIQHIMTWSDEGDLVFDPFMGSGTTAKAARHLKRNFIGSEISAEYCAIAEQRLKNLQPSLI